MRVFKRFRRLGVGSDKMVLSRPAHQQVTQTVGQHTLGESKMTMNSTAQKKAWEVRHVFWSVVKLLVGGFLGATAYLLIAKIIVDRTFMGCSPGFFRSVIEASKFPASMLVGSMNPESMFYQPVQYLLASVPYAILGALIVSGSKRTVILVVGLLTLLGLCASLLLWVFYIGFICA